MRDFTLVTMIDTETGNQIVNSKLFTDEASADGYMLNMIRDYEPDADEEKIETALGDGYFDVDSNHTIFKTLVYTAN